MNEIYYAERGSGFPLLLLHGNGESHEYFASQLEYFSVHYRVIAPDTRGHGRTPRGDGELSISRFADDLHDFVMMIGIEKANILGFSDGGNIAMYFALRYPEYVGKLVLNGANLFPRGVKRSVQLPIEIGYRIASHFAKKSDDALKNAEILGLMVNEPRLTAEDASRIKAPTLVIAGTRYMIKRSHTELIAKSIPNSQLVFIKGDHSIANKNPDAFNAAVGKFLAE